MKIVIFGKDGQVGRALQQVLHAQSEILFIGKKECDLGQCQAIKKILEEYEPTIIINAAAYTAVDQAETDSELVHAINAEAPKVIADYIAFRRRGLLIHFSTDYVFSDSFATPYSENHETGPVNKLNSYGQSKYHAELSIVDILGRTELHSRYLILRTSWVYGDGKNFIKSILNLASQRQSLNIVADQVGAPTSSHLLARVVKEFIQEYQENDSEFKSDIFHVCPQGYTSWHGLAQFVISVIRELMPEKILSEAHSIVPLFSTEYPTRAMRPYNSRLSNNKLNKYLTDIKSSLKLECWQYDVKKYLQSLIEDEGKHSNDEKA